MAKGVKRPRADFAANIAKATGETAKPTKAAATAAAKPSQVDANQPTKKPGRFNLPPDPTPAAEIDDGILKLPVQEGSPCQVKGCPGRYSIVQTVKVKTQLQRTFICRTCLHIPGD